MIDHDPLQSNGEPQIFAVADAWANRNMLAQVARLPPVEPTALGGRTSDAPHRAMAVIGDVAVIDVVGFLSKAVSFERLKGFSQQPTLVEICSAIRAAHSDPDIRAILLRVNSPGGAVAGTFAVADALFEARKRKRIVAYAEDVMASAAYAIGSQANEIIGTATGSYGAIGVCVMLQDHTAALERDGVSVRLVRSRALKGLGEPSVALSDEGLANLQQRVDDLDDVFVRTVQRTRLITRDAIDNMSGGSFVGARARDLGLIDHIGTMDDALAATQRTERNMT